MRVIKNAQKDEVLSSDAVYLNLIPFPPHDLTFYKPNIPGNAKRRVIKQGKS
jgi:hypothetical protein